MPPRILYLHGFASGPDSAKGLSLAERLAPRGLHVERVDLNVPTFEALSLGAQRDLVTGLLKQDPRPAVLAGSSMGGYLAALLADASPTVSAVLLLAPAFDLASRWRSTLPREDLARWQREGSLGFYHHALRREVALHYRFLEEADALPPWPSVSLPVCVVQGRRDVTVPPALARRWVDANPHARYVELDDDHQLLASVGAIEHELLALLSALDPATPGPRPKDGATHGEPR